MSLERVQPIDFAAPEDETSVDRAARAIVDCLIDAGESHDHAELLVGRLIIACGIASGRAQQ